MRPIHNHKLIVLRFAYLHIHPGDGLEKTILLAPSFQRFLDHDARLFLAELLDFIDAHVPHETRNLSGFYKWVAAAPTSEDQESYDHWVSAITPVPMPDPEGWTEVDTSHG
jgi:hypothetical protein